MVSELHTFDPSMRSKSARRFAPQVPSFVVNSTVYASSDQSASRRLRRKSLRPNPPSVTPDHRASRRTFAGRTDRQLSAEVPAARARNAIPIGSSYVPSPRQRSVAFVLFTRPRTTATNGEQGPGQETSPLTIGKAWVVEVQSQNCILSFPKVTVKIPRRGHPPRSLLRPPYERRHRLRPIGGPARTRCSYERRHRSTYEGLYAGEHRSRAIVDFRFRKSPFAVSVTEAPTGWFTKPARLVLERDGSRGYSARTTYFRFRK